MFPKLVPRLFAGLMLSALILLSTVNCFEEEGEDDSPGVPATEVQLEPILTTATSSFYLSSIATEASVAHQLCVHRGGNLLYVESSEELENIKTAMTNLQENDNDILWTSAIRYSNATVEDLTVWSNTQEPFSFPLTENNNPRWARFSRLNSRFSVRNRRAAVSIRIGDEIAKTTTCEPCDCSSTTIRPLPPRPDCKRPNCEGSRPACTEIEPRKCLIARPPICEAQEKNCTVECGTPEDCRVIRQPVCTITPSSRPNCRLELPNLGNCRTVRPPKCTITKPGHCHSLPVTCEQESLPCKPIIKPCKNPCSQQECSTVQPPCVTEKPPCQDITTPCPPRVPSVECLRRCKRNALSKESRFKCEEDCKPAPIDCGQQTVCPPEVTVCPPPISTCTRPFVDCSPEICQSNVLLCPPPKVHCPPAQVHCTSPEVVCDDPGVECPEPEVICDQPDVTCTKPLIKCPDPVVHCDPIITTCEAAPTVCSDPVLNCPDPIINCGEPTTCPVPPESGCTCGSKCGNRSRRDVSAELDLVEKTECIAFNSATDESEWIAQNCDLKHRFICRM